MTEPSPEAVEQLRATIQLAKDSFSDIRQDWSDPREDIRSGQEALDQALVLVDSALRAVKQRTRLETLERAATYVREWPASDGTDGEGNRVRAACARIADGIASLQPEAPKAEEPKR